MRKSLLRNKYAAGTSDHPVYKQYRDIARYWILQILFDFGVHKKVLLENMCIEDDILDEVGLEQYTVPGEYKMKEVQQLLSALYQEVCKKQPPLPTNTILARSITVLGDAIGLTPAEKDFLHFRAVASRYKTLRIAIEHFGKGVDLFSACHYVSILLGIEQDEVRNMLQPSGKLIQSGIISVAPGLDDLFGKLSLLSGVVDNLFLKVALQ